MKYREALDYVEKQRPLKGTIDEKGFLVGDIVIVPSEKTKCDLFLQNYIQNGENEVYTFGEDDDVEVWAIDTAYLEKANVLFYNKLAY